MTSAFSWQNSISLCPASFCTPRPNLLLLQVFLDFLLLHSSPLWWKGHLLGVFISSLVGLHRTVRLLQRYGWGIDLDYRHIEWFALESNYPPIQKKIQIHFSQSKIKLLADLVFWVGGSLPGLQICLLAVCSQRPFLGTCSWREKSFSSFSSYKGLISSWGSIFMT